MCPPGLNLTTDTPKLIQCPSNILRDLKARPGKKNSIEVRGSFQVGVSCLDQFLELLVNLLIPFKKPAHCLHLLILPKFHSIKHGPATSRIARVTGASWTVLASPCDIFPHKFLLYISGKFSKFCLNHFSVSVDMSRTSAVTATRVRHHMSVKRIETVNNVKLQICTVKLQVAVVVKFMQFMNEVKVTTHNHRTPMKLA